jgi:hypothetical protein
MKKLDQSDRQRRMGQRQRIRRRRRQTTNREKRRKGGRRGGIRHTEPIFKQGVKRLVRAAYEKCLHAKQHLSIFMICVGVLWSDRLGVAAVGRGMASAYGLNRKHAIKQVDRHLSNAKLPLQKLFPGYIKMAVGSRVDLYVTLDWTEFDRDDHSTLSLGLLTRCRRATPLLWKTVKKSKLKGNQRRHERELLAQLRQYLPAHVKRVVIVADRGFGDVALYAHIEKLGFDFVIRFRENIYTRLDEWLWPTSQLVYRNGRIRVIRDTSLTCKEVGPYTVVLVKRAGMKDPWCLATNLREAEGTAIVKLYSRRFTCEESFRDLKDRRYGYGLRSTRIRNPLRRDRFLMLFAFVYLVLTLVGQCSERLGLDRTLRANTAETRTHSLFNQARALLGNIAAGIYEELAAQFRELLKQLLREGVPAVL